MNCHLPFAYYWIIKDFFSISFLLSKNSYYLNSSSISFYILNIIFILLQLKDEFHLFPFIDQNIDIKQLVLFLQKFYIVFQYSLINIYNKITIKTDTQFGKSMIQDFEQYPSLSTLNQNQNGNYQSERQDTKSNVPSTIDKADPEKATSANSQTNFRLKFNTSYDNIKCFIHCEKTQRKNHSSTRLVKQSKSAVQLPTSHYANWQKGQGKLSKKQIIYDEKQQITKSQSIKEEQNQNDVSNVLSNEIIHHIEQKGIYCKWTEIQEIKSESVLSENIEDYQTVNELFHTFSDKKSRSSYQETRKSSEFTTFNQSYDQNTFKQNEDNLGDRSYKMNQNFCNFQINQAKQYEKNFSFASTMDPYSNIYQNPNSTELFSSNQNQQNLSIQMGYSMMNEYMMLNGFDDYTIIPDYLQHDPRTTIMIKNIPNKYTIHYLSEEIDKQFGNYYDFLYLPCDIKSGANQGYGFINFVDKDAIRRFYEKFHGKKWRRFRSQKICNLTYGRLQGINSLIDHFQNSKVLNHKEKKYQPIIKKLPEIHHLIKKQQDKELQRK